MLLLNFMVRLPRAYAISYSEFNGPTSTYDKDNNYMIYLKRNTYKILLTMDYDQVAKVNGVDETNTKGQVRVSRKKGKSGDFIRIFINDKQTLDIDQFQFESNAKCYSYQVTCNSTTIYPNGETESTHRLYPNYSQLNKAIFKTEYFISRYAKGFKNHLRYDSGIEIFDNYYLEKDSVVYRRKLELEGDNKEKVCHIFYIVCVERG